MIERPHLMVSASSVFAGANARGYVNAKFDPFTSTSNFLVDSPTRSLPLPVPHLFRILAWFIVSGVIASESWRWQRWNTPSFLLH